jgi:hypothetical protein
MTVLLTSSLLCIAVGLIMVFFHHRKSQSSPEDKAKKNDRFAADMLSALKEFYPDTPFVYDPRSDMIEAAAGYDGPHDYKFFLGNLRNRVLEMGQEARQQYIRETMVILGIMRISSVINGMLVVIVNAMCSHAKISSYLFSHALLNAFAPNGVQS